jgi:thiosulfate/3-mercaptopyruvate sulfurtransferase
MSTFHPQRSVGLCAIVLAALALACASHRASAPPSPRETIVSVEQLPAQLARGGPDLVVLDARDRPAYDAQHLDGAVFVPLAEWERLSLGNDTGLSHEAAWRERIGALGIDGDDRVLVYDNGKMTQAARVWFILQHFGVADAAVIDGGYPLLAEAAAQGSVKLSATPLVRAAATFEPSAEAAIGLVDRAAMKLAVERGEAQILDVRTEAEFLGDDLRNNARGGHLPNAVNLPHTRLLDERGRLRSVDELEQLLRDAGFERGRPVIMHCDGGGRAALAALAAARAGYGPVLNYYLSFGDWAKDATCPVVKD